MAQNGNEANAYHTKSLANKVWWSRWREVELCWTVGELLIEAVCGST